MSVKASTNLFLDIAIFLACLLAMSPRVTGIAVHEWLSLSFAAAIVAHLLFHWEWIVGVAPSFFKKLLHESRLNFAVDLVFFVSIVLIMASGIIISKVAAPALGLSFAFSPVWKGVHKVSADVALLALGVHCAMHWKWIVRNFMKWVAGPVMGLFGKNAAAKVPAGTMATARASEGGRK